jgi:O-antigen ligase
LSIDPTLTGRDQVWQFTLNYISRRPWLGVGFGSFWDAAPTSKESLFDFGITFAFGQAHNGYLDVLVQVGTVGMACVIVMALAILFRLFRLARAGYDNVVIVIAFMTFSVIWLHNITESTLLRPGTDMWIYFVLLTLTVFKTRGNNSHQFPAR